MSIGARPGALRAGLLVLGLVGALVAAVGRYRVEQRNRQVEIAIDYQEAVRLASGLGLSTRDVLSRLRQAGVTSVGIAETTLVDLVDSGAAVPAASTTVTTVRFEDPALLAQVAAAWDARGVRRSDGPSGFDESVVLWSPRAQGGSGGYVAYRGGYAALRLLGAGWPLAALGDARAANLRVVARLSNFAGASASSMERVLSEVRSTGAETVVCMATEVLGYYGQHRETAEAFRKTGVRFGQVEFGKQKGDERLGAALRGEFVRVHSIAEGEMGTLSEDTAVERFVRAARERNVRLCYVRLLTYAGEDALAANARYIDRICNGIRRNGDMAIGPARVFSDPGTPVWAFGLAALAAGAMLSLVVGRFVPATGLGAMAMHAALVAAPVALAVIGDGGRRLAALTAALASPVMAMLPLVEGVAAKPHEARQSIARAAAAGARQLARTSLVTFLGALCVVGLLSSRPFMVKSSQFLGIKAAHGLPVLIIAAMLVTALPAAGASWRAGWEQMRARAAAFLAEPARIGPLLLTLVLVGALGLALARTGNEPGVGVSGIELKLRSILDAALPARPRTKEFLIGYPALVLAVGLALRHRKTWVGPLLVVGAIGQVSLLNTFCHIHTPLRISAVRVVVGLVLGCLIGAAALLLSETVSGATQRKREATGSQPASARGD